mgnify:CR=1 FL=1
MELVDGMRTLSKKDTGNTLYILDEPTTGLHFEDIKVLLEVINKLVKKGNTVIIIEHNMDVIANSDWVVDLGPEGGEAGGQVMFSGPLDELPNHKQSHTAEALRQQLELMK